MRKILDVILHILSRNPTLDTAHDQQTYNDLLARLKLKFLPVTRLKNTPQPQSCNYDGQQPGDVSP